MPHAQGEIPEVVGRALSGPSISRIIFQRPVGNFADREGLPFVMLTADFQFEDRPFAIADKRKTNVKTLRPKVTTILNDDPPIPLGSQTEAGKWQEETTKGIFSRQPRPRRFLHGQLKWLAIQPQSPTRIFLGLEVGAEADFLGRKIGDRRENLFIVNAPVFSRANIFGKAQLRFPQGRRTLPGDDSVGFQESVHLNDLGTKAGASIFFIKNPGMKLLPAEGYRA